MPMRASYIALAILSVIPALILILFLQGSQPGTVTDLAWITFLILMLDFILSIIILFIEGKFRPVEKIEQKS
jgi:ABC-type polysaccharide/polyol phosphate export permease